MIPGVNIISGKANVESVNGAGGSGGTLSPSARILGGGAPSENFQALKSI